MKVLIQKLPIDPDASFVARTYETPYFETPWHQHVEYELMVVSKGNGTVFIGDYIGEYAKGEVYFLGKNLPHWFRKQSKEMVGSSMVVHFREDFLGKDFFNLPEMAAIQKLLLQSRQGLLLQGEMSQKIAIKLAKIEAEKNFAQWMELMTALHEISQSDEFILLNKSPIIQFSTQDQNSINIVFEFSMQNFQRKIKLDEVAALNHQSISAFCHFFKRSTKKSYIRFLTELRIAHACKLIRETNKNITEICFESGFHSWANFSKQFKSEMGMAPSQFRKQNHS